MKPSKTKYCENTFYTNMHTYIQPRYLIKTHSKGFAAYISKCSFLLGGGDMENLKHSLSSTPFVQTMIHHYNFASSGKTKELSTLE